MWWLARLAVMLALVSGAALVSRADYAGQGIPENKRVHVVFIVDTDDPTLGPNLRYAMHHFGRAMARQLGWSSYPGLERFPLRDINPDPKTEAKEYQPPTAEIPKAVEREGDLKGRVLLNLLAGEDVKKSKILETITGLKATSEDTVFVYFLGHGIVRAGEGHGISLTNEDEKNNFILRRDLLAAMRTGANSPRLTVLVTDACADIKLPPKTVEESVEKEAYEARPASEKVEAKPWTVARDLLLKHRGVVDINSARPGHSAWVSHETKSYLGPPGVKRLAGRLLVPVRPKDPPKEDKPKVVYEIYQLPHFTWAFTEKFTATAKDVDEKGNNSGFVEWEEFFGQVRKEADTSFKNWRKANLEADPKLAEQEDQLAWTNTIEPFLRLGLQVDAGAGGVRIERVVLPDKLPAGKSGKLAVGDIIQEVDGKPIRSVNEFEAWVDSHDATNDVELKLKISRDGRTQDVSVKLEY